MTNAEKKEACCTALVEASHLAKALMNYYGNLADDRNEYPDEEFEDDDQNRWADSLLEQIRGVVESLGIDAGEIIELTEEPSQPSKDAIALLADAAEQHASNIEEGMGLSISDEVLENDALWANMLEEFPDAIDREQANYARDLFRAIKTVR